MSAAPSRGHSPARRVLAWGVHVFTASGAVLGAASLLAIRSGDLRLAGLFMLVALFLDSVDGTLARAARVSEVLPHMDGRRLDDMVDYLNYVVVPAVFMVAAQSLVSAWLVAVPILASAYGFAHHDAKTEDDFFLGFPSYWNVVALYLWLFDASPRAGTALVLFFAALVFVPLKYLYPSKMSVLRHTTNAAAGVWWFALLACVLAPDASRVVWLAELSLVFPAYYFVASLWLGGLHRSPR